MLTIGSNIPQATLDAYIPEIDDFKKISLSEYEGKWLALIFYPGDFTFICPTELEEAAELYPEFQKLGAEILSVSTDTAFVHKAWHDNSPAIKKVKFPMVADPTGNLCRTFGTYIEAGTDEGQSLRGSFVIDPEGLLRTIEIHHNDVGRSMSELLRKVQAMKFVLENPGQVCPANWKPGSETLEPGVGLVGVI